MQKQISITLASRTIMCSFVLILGLSTILLDIGTNGLSLTANVNITEDCVCGRRPENIQARIVGGEEAQKHSHPWLVALLFLNQIRCAGSIINDRYILTAGHCVHNMRHRMHDLTVALGMHNVDLEWVVIVNIREIILHPDYKKHVTHSVFDLALLRLAHYLQFSDYISPICLPFGDAETPEGRAATVAGWGLLSENGSLPDALQETYLRVMPENECKEVKVFSEDSMENFLCAIGPNSDACEYDSGGSLVWESRKRFEQIGIVSWGIGCARPGIPGIYTKVSEYLKWIADYTRDAMYCKDPMSE